MAIGTPIYTPKLPYLFAMLFALGILFLDQKYDYFAPLKDSKTYLFAETKNLSNKVLISSNNFFNGFKSSQELAIEIDNLKENIDLLSIENNLIRQNIDSKNISFDGKPSKIIEFNTHQYFCCSQHRLIANTDSNYAQGYVINKTGLIGQIYNQIGRYAEVILLSDKRHKIPLMDDKNTFFCIGKGMGTPKKIQCEIDNDFVNENLIDSLMLTSGFGGIFDRGIEVGHVIDTELKSDLVVITIGLIADPLLTDKVYILKKNEL